MVSLSTLVFKNGSAHKFMRSIPKGPQLFVGTLRSHDHDGNGNVKRQKVNEQSNNSAPASRIFAHFFAFTAQLRPNFKFTWERERQGDKFYHLCPNLSAFPSLQLHPKSPSFK